MDTMKQLQYFKSIDLATHKPIRAEIEALTSKERHNIIHKWNSDVMARTPKYEWNYNFVDEHGYAIRWRKGRLKREIDRLQILTIEEAERLFQIDKLKCEAYNNQN